MAMGLQYNTVSNLNLKTIFYFVTITLNKFYINKNVIMKTPILIYQMLKKLIIKVWDSSHWSVFLKGGYKYGEIFKNIIKIEQVKKNGGGVTRDLPRENVWKLDAKSCILTHFWCYNPESKLCPENDVFLFSRWKKNQNSSLHIFIYYQ